MTPEQCRAARALLGWSQEDLAERAGISRKPLADYERGAESEALPKTLAALRGALEKAGVEFIPENGGGIGVRLKKAKKRRG